jgi:hypothetical protein
MNQPRYSLSVALAASTADALRACGFVMFNLHFYLESLVVKWLPIWEKRHFGSKIGFMSWVKQCSAALSVQIEPRRLAPEWVSLQFSSNDQISAWQPPW